MVVAAMQGANRHIRSCSRFSILPKDTSTCRPGESNQRPSNNRTLALPLNHSRPMPQDGMHVTQEYTHLQNSLQSIHCYTFHTRILGYMDVYKLRTGTHSLITKYIYNLPLCKEVAPICWHHNDSLIGTYSGESAGSWRICDRKRKRIKRDRHVAGLRNKVRGLQRRRGASSTALQSCED